MRPEQIRDAYDRLAPRYDNASSLLDRVVTGELRREFGLRLSGSVLEVAIGTGRNLPYYAPTVTRATGIDLSAGMLAEARQRADAHEIPVDLVQMDAERLAFPADTFDSVAICEALCTIPHPERALEELMRVCRPGGSAVFLEHVRSPNPFVHQFQRLVTPIPERGYGCSWVRDSISAIRAAGFEITGDRSRLFGVFRLVVARCPGPDEQISD